MCELVMKTLRQELSAEGRTDILQQVMAYRGGYSQEVSLLVSLDSVGLLLEFSAQDRRRIEAEAFSGNLLGIVATNALELGVDIGSLDAVLVHGFPPTVASFVRVLPRLSQYTANA
jgi:DEAD/DEAH box helicase domain-containing protein